MEKNYLLDWKYIHRQLPNYNRGVLCFDETEPGKTNYDYRRDVFVCLYTEKGFVTYDGEIKNPILWTYFELPEKSTK